jgi:UDP-glucose 6-dehydrogenase
MRLTIAGFGHFAQIVGACLRQRGHSIVQFDYEPFLKRPDQREAREEPGWAEMAFPALEEDSKRADPDLVWIAYDVPLDAAGAPVVDAVLARIERIHDDRPRHIPFLVSCQWPVGTMRKIAGLCPGREFVYVMENVRAGKAIEDFKADPLPAIGALGLPSGTVWKFIKSLATVKEPWCSAWETIEFAKHSLNAFLALQIAFVNELARIAPDDVDMADVTRVLRSDPRVSPKAPLLAGAPFGGGSLKRDLLVLDALGVDRGLVYTPILDAILPSNENNPQWIVKP